VIYTTASIFIFIKSGKIIVQEIFLNSYSSSGKDQRIKKDKKKKETLKPPKSLFYLALTAGAFVLAFSKTYWFQSTSLEVYALHILLINLVIYFVFKSFQTNSAKENNRINIYWFYTAILLALSFTNHMTSLLLVPGLAFLFFTIERGNKKLIVTLILMLSSFLIIFTCIYVYLPLRAESNPILNWGNPDIWERFLRHISGNQYQSWIFSSFESAQKQLSYFIKTLPSEFAVVGFIPALIGIVTSFRKARKIFYFLAIIFLSTIFYSINYDIHDIDSYFLLAYIALAFWTIYGFTEFGF